MNDKELAGIEARAEHVKIGGSWAGVSPEAVLLLIKEIKKLKNNTDMNCVGCGKPINPRICNTCQLLGVEASK